MKEWKEHKAPTNLIKYSHAKNRIETIIAWYVYVYAYTLVKLHV